MLKVNNKITRTTSDSSSGIKTWFSGMYLFDVPLNYRSKTNKRTKKQTRNPGKAINGKNIV